ncbi:hypothetical protein HK105_204674 [Polyrhizophydium stewartii]|uniref:Uncharacterized protein n=1 Tax=Polyrhizophydium stewartii TaxID=2732419 RepID=A0ABR4N870_9FUNG
MPKRRLKITKAAETPGVWDYGFKDGFVSTHGADFTDKSKEVGERPRRGIQLRDHVWFLGFEDADLLYRRKRTAKASTNATDFSVPGFPRPFPTPEDLAKPAGRPTPLDNPSGFKYSSETLASFTSGPTPRSYTRSHPLTNKKHFGIHLSPKEQSKRSGVQTFTDYNNNDSQASNDRTGMSHRDHDRMILHKRIDAGLTVPIAGL